MASFFGAIGNFFKKLFSGPSRAGSSERKLALEEIEGFLKKSAQKERGFLEALVAKKFSEIKHILRQLESMLGKLESKGIETENPKLGKIVETSRRQASRQLYSLVQKLSPPNLQDLAAVRKFSRESELFLSREIPAFGKNIVYTSIVLKDDIKGIGALVQELQKNFSELNSEFEKNKKVFLETAAVEKIKKISENREKTASLGALINSASLEISSSREAFEAMVSDFESFSNSGEAKRLAGLEEKKASWLSQRKALEQGIFEKISSVEKPMRKLSKLVEEQKASVSKQEQKFLQDFLSNPLIALKRDPRGDYFKGLLRELKNQFSAGAIELKEKELEKKQAVLEELLGFDFFENFFWKSNNIEIELAKTEKEIRSLDFSRKRIEKEKLISQASALLEEKNSFLNAQKSGLEKTQEACIALQKELESTLSEAFPEESIKIVA